MQLIIICNNKNPPDSKLGRIVWTSIKNLRIVSKVREEISIKAIKHMKLRDREGNKFKKVAKNQSP